jgi:hypothetical protein
MPKNEERKYVVDINTAHRFLKNLVRPYRAWAAYREGVINDEGKIIVPREKRNRKQLDSFGYFDIIALNLKKLLGKISGGKSAIATYTAAAMLLKDLDYVPSLKYIVGPSDDLVNEELDMDLLRIDFERTMEEVELMFEEMIEEDGEAPTNNVSGGKIAGAIGDPPVKPKNKYKAQNEIDGKAIARRILGLSGVR